MSEPQKHLSTRTNRVMTSLFPQLLSGILDWPLHQSPWVPGYLSTYLHVEAELRIAGLEDLCPQSKGILETSLGDFDTFVLTSHLKTIKINIAPWPQHR